MPIEVRCYTCNKVIANKYDTYQNYLEQGMSSNDALDKLKLNRYCCRRMILSYVNIDEQLLEYSNYDMFDKTS